MREQTNILIGFAQDLAEIARDKLQAYVADSVDMRTKGDSSPVTDLDLEIERAMRERILGRYPCHGILGEEYGADRIGADIVWVLDPIDGTAHFIAGVPLFGTLIAITRGGQPWIGLIDIPMTGDRWIGVAGEWATRNAEVARTRPCRSLSRAFMSCSNPDMQSAAEAAQFLRVKKSVSYTLYGASSFAFGALASGRTDVAVDAGLGTHDIMAPCAIISGAGGAMTDWKGEALRLGSSGQTIAVGDRNRLMDVVALLQAECSAC
ncbi:inositol monophosphatase [Agrobacterium vitis]|uniref:inositol monophosphatase family protein n=1 Tax=Rhizobium/Agrobacterium group TaxID=227290 RepID=UPI0008DC0239|nr:MULTISPECIES: inositol monophosphatase family protein [Rhizobium/Agrobacterium group]MCF1436840.1 inositol monophosphatase [Allorhizobium ampelinum]MUO92326.1 inositol monophosphatase [Agrobacterium vitis]MUZ55147.1 inositol monophosphatase [Agrobacterium vitis]MUZ94282.1 inositol monophosphatase [Agrobacterium vitis]MVA43196.1 inositol monophosphatase [Agrobacterium vitis]